MRFEDRYVGIGLDAGLPERGNVPFFPGGFLHSCIRCVLGLLLVIGQQVIHVVLISLGAVGTKGSGNACRLLDGDPLPAFGERRGKERGTELIRALLSAEEGDVLLAERQVDLGEFVERGKLARIGRFQPDMGHGFGDRLWLPFFRLLLSLLHRFPARLPFIQVRVSLLYRTSSFLEACKAVSRSAQTKLVQVCGAFSLSLAPLSPVRRCSLRGTR